MRDPSGDYVVLAEHEPWYVKYLPVTTVHHRGPGAPVFVTSVVFAPIEICGPTIEFFNLQPGPIATGGIIIEFSL